MIATSTTTFSAQKLFDLETLNSIPGNPDWTNLIFRRRKVEEGDFRGPGIYACFFQDKLIYIGKFLGKRHAPYEGDITRARWDKHLATLTLRGRSLSFSKRTFDHIFSLPQDARPTGLEASSRESLTRDRGALSTFNRFKFSQANWTSFLALDTAALDKFKFVYVRLHTNARVNELHGFEGVRRAISATEALLVDQLQPCCNACIPNGPYPSVLGVDDFEKSAQGAIQKIFEADDIVNTLIKALPSKQTTDLAESYIVPTNGEDLGEPISAKSIFLEQLDTETPGALAAINILISSFGNEHEVHFKKRSPVDMRIRCTGVIKSRAQNIFTVQWRSRSKKFVIHAYAGIEDCKRLGARNALETEAREPLATKFEFDPQIDDVNVLLNIVCTSIESFRRGGDSR